MVRVHADTQGMAHPPFNATEHSHTSKEPGLRLFFGKDVEEIRQVQGSWKPQNCDT